MANWWDAAPLVEPAPQSGGNWWEAAPLVAPSADASTAAAPAPTALGAGNRAIVNQLTFGYGDEIMAGALTPIEMGVRAIRGEDWSPSASYSAALAREHAEAGAEQSAHPIAYGASSLLGAAVAGGGLVKAGLSVGARAAQAGAGFGKTLLASAADGAAIGALTGFGEGEGGLDNRGYEAFKGAVYGTAAGAALPVAAHAIGKTYGAARDYFRAPGIAKSAGTTPEALRTLGGIMAADDSLGPRGVANMARAGQEAMLVDAGPTARRALDTAVQRSGPGARVAMDAVEGRVARDSDALTDALDTAMGQPAGGGAVKPAYSPATGELYDAAYTSAIDYSQPAAMWIEDAVKSRVPYAAVRAANDLMRVEGVPPSKQILARVGDDGFVALERLPDVMQLDYITRGLRHVADIQNAKGQIGGTTPIGRAYGNLATEIRGRLKGLVPAYREALESASSEIGQYKAGEFGASLLSPSVTRSQVAETVASLRSPEEMNALVQGARQQIDDAMARVSRTVMDGDVPAREAISALKNLSSRANREKLGMVLGEERAGQLFGELDRVAQTFDLRAGIANNSATYARGEMQRRIGDAAAPGVVESAARGEPKSAAKKLLQLITGMTDDVIRAREDGMYAEMARLLTQRGGAGQTVYDAINALRTTDKGTQAVKDTIYRLIVGPQAVAPALTTVQGQDKRDAARVRGGNAGLMGYGGR